MGGKRAGPDPEPGIAWEKEHIPILGHGGFHDNAAVLYFEDEQHNPVPIIQAELVDLFKSLSSQKHPRLVFLNACDTAGYTRIAAQAA